SRRCESAALLDGQRRNLYSALDCGAVGKKDHKLAAGALLFAFRAVVLHTEPRGAGAMDVGQHQGPGLLVARLGAVCRRSPGLSVHATTHHRPRPGGGVADWADVFRSAGRDARAVTR